MSWRTALGAFVGLLLPLPLVLLLGSTLRLGTAGQQWVDGRRVSPILGHEERQRLRTYHRDCSPSTLCEPPLGCLEDIRYRATYCTDSQCLSDTQCPDGHSCRLLATINDGPLVRMCVPLGIRQEGEPCYELSDDKEGACAPGLTCGGEAGWCSRPCKKEDPASCPEGFFCADTDLEPLCQPTCENRGCPEGQHCMRHEGGTSACARVYGPQCQQTPCPEGSKCQVFRDTNIPDRVWTKCEGRCGKDFPPCPPGLVCDRVFCEQPCDPNGPNTCGEGFHCFQRRPTRPWVCNPDW
jgi:hypothetical protein